MTQTKREYKEDKCLFKTSFFCPTQQTNNLFSALVKKIWNLGAKMMNLSTRESI